MFHFSSPSSAVCVKVEGFTPNFHTVTNVKLKLKKNPKNLVYPSVSDSSESLGQHSDILRSFLISISGRT